MKIGKFFIFLTGEIFAAAIIALIGVFTYRLYNSHKYNILTIDNTLCAVEENTCKVVPLNSTLRKDAPPSLKRINGYDFSGRMGISHGDVFSGFIYNGNDQFHASKICISVTVTPSDKDKAFTRKYFVNCEIPPLAKGSCSTAIDTGGYQDFDTSWNIEYALGRREPYSY